VLLKFKNRSLGTSFTIGVPNDLFFLYFSKNEEIISISEIAGDFARGEKAEKLRGKFDRCGIIRTGLINAGRHRGRRRWQAQFKTCG
jgi:hypothetical protein